MTVGELIALLSEFPDDLPVVVDGYEGGLEIPHVRPERIDLDNPRAQHDYDGYYNSDLGYVEDANAICISREEPTPGYDREVVQLEELKKRESPMG